MVLKFCPTNSADKHSLQFTINKIVHKIFGAMSNDLYSETCVHFEIDLVENLVANRRNRFIKMVKQTIIYVKCCADPFRLFGCVFFFAFV